MSKIQSLIAAAALAGAALTLSGGPTFAAIVCSGDACWHTRESLAYPPAAHIVVHPDNWRWRNNEHYRWREHEGHGYWAGDQWRAF